MCGIAGIVKVDPTERPERWRLERMRDSLAHRGPDGEGIVVDGPSGLVHRRLAIIDPRRGEQPMCNEDGSVWITYNGEIYNHQLLRRTLLATGHRFQSNCDTEAIVHLYEEAGLDAVTCLEGMFAFAIWDRSCRRLVLARDPLGIKPLYYARTSTELVFGSEIKAVLAAGAVQPAFNEEVLPEYLATRYVSGDATFYRDIYKVPPGHVLVWSAREGLKTHRYWELPSPVEEPGRTVRAEAVEVRRRLESAVHSHLMSDVPLGVLLSGGIDSSALAALAARHVKAPIETFSVGFAETEANELPYARLMAQHVGAVHRDVTIEPGAFFDALPRLIWQEDEPLAFPSSVPLYFVANLARQHGVRVVLTGEGADELFLGYNRYRVTLWNHRLGRPYWRIAPRGIQERVRRLVTGLPAPLAHLAHRSFLGLDAGLRGVYLENFAVLSDALQRRILLRPELLASRDPYAATLSADPTAVGDLRDRMSRIDLSTYLHELLMKQDQMSMAASVESRVPFLDYQLVDYVARIPGRLKLPAWETKLILREAVRDIVPKVILDRRKMGFPVPIGPWFQRAYWPVIEEFVLGPRAQARRFFDPGSVRILADAHRAGEGRHADRLWSLVNLEIWQRIALDGEAPDGVMDAVWRTRGRTVHANPLGQDGRPVAADGWRPRAEPRDRIGALRAASPHTGHDARV